MSMLKILLSSRLAVFVEQYLKSHLSFESFDFIENLCEADFMPFFPGFETVCGASVVGGGFLLEKIFSKPNLVYVSLYHILFKYITFLYF